MSDPNLFARMHGIYSTEAKKKGDRAVNKDASNSPPVDPAITDSDELALEEAIQNEVDRLMTLENASANSLLPPAAIRAKIEQEVRASLDFSELGKLMSSAFEIMRRDGSICLEKEEDENLQESLDQLCERLGILDLKELTDETKKAALAMPAEIQNLILRIGIEKFRQAKFDEGLSIFTFLTTVEEDEADYWYRLGLIAMLCSNYDLALRAFTSTSHLAPGFIGAHLYSAECYLKTGRRTDAMSELKEAKKCPKNDKTEDWQAHILEIEHMLVESA